MTDLLNHLTQTPWDESGLTSDAVDLGHSVVDGLLDACRSEPLALAAIGDEGTMTRAELWAACSEVASRLRELGIGAEDRVAILDDHGLATLVAVWGALLAGAAYVPLSTEYPADRLRFLLGDSLGDSSARCVLTSAGQVATVADLGLGTPVLAVDPALTHRAGTATPCSRPGDLAYVVYTSGSTGRPKGVMVEHINIAHQMAVLRAVGALSPQSRILNKTPLIFDAAQWEVLAPAVGAVVVTAAPHTYRDPAELLSRVQRHGVTDLQCVPTLWAALTQTGSLYRCTSLRRTYSGGEVLSTSLAREITSQLPQCTLTNLYGPTETTINICTNTIDMDSLPETTSVPIGRPLPGASLSVVDEALADVPTGTIGELCISGPQVARGYLGNEELSAKRFAWREVGGQRTRCYLTGDRARVTERGELEFHGRDDDQVKIRGHRIELNEVKLAITGHRWVQDACVVPFTSPRTGAQQLAAFVTLDEAEAALMDQGIGADHHASKASHVQVRAQLSQAPLHDHLRGATAIALVEPSQVCLEQQAVAAFRRKTYRSYRGEQPSGADLRAWLAAEVAAVPVVGTGRQLDAADLGSMLRWFEPFASSERLLPKFSYASPGALNGVRLYLELSGVEGIVDGVYFHDRDRHELIAVSTSQKPSTENSGSSVRLHLVGARSVIARVYSTNIEEVLHFEAGHMLGALDQALIASRWRAHTVAAPSRSGLGIGDDGDQVSLVSVEITSESAPDEDAVAVYVQHEGGRVGGLARGTFGVEDGEFVKVLEEPLVRQRDVIAINQVAYEASQFGILLAAPRVGGYSSFVALGRAMHRLQATDSPIGLMSSGYSSLSGRDLPSARRYDELIGHDMVTYFAVGGAVSSGQLAARDMAEDAVHMRGPTELLAADLAATLPHYMVPASIQILDELPKTPSGKCDVPQLRRRMETVNAPRTVIAATTEDELRLIGIWSRLLNDPEPSMDDDFFAAGGNSLIGLRLVNEVNDTFGADLPMQAIFEGITPRVLSDWVAGATPIARLDRLIGFHAPGTTGRPVFCWPGLGGFPMNLRELGGRLDPERQFFGVQASGINPGETHEPDIASTAAADIEMILRHQPEGPFALIGYSYGARVAFEAAYQFERRGLEVDCLILIAPGSPITAHSRPDQGRRATLKDPYFVQMLLSVFTGSLDEELLDQTMAGQPSLSSVVKIVSERTGIPEDVARRISRLVQLTFSFEYRFEELTSRRVVAPVTIVKARGDNYSFIEGAGARQMNVISLDHGHYDLLTGPGLDTLVHTLRPSVSGILPPTNNEAIMPHVTIEHFPHDLSEEARAYLADKISAVVARAFACDSSAISIATRSVPAHEWTRLVYQPRIEGRAHELLKTPLYAD